MHDVLFGLLGYHGQRHEYICVDERERDCDGVVDERGLPLSMQNMVA